MEQTTLYTKKLAEKLAKRLNENVEFKAVFKTDHTCGHQIMIGPEGSGFKLNLEDCINEKADINDDEILNTIEQIYKITKKKKELEINMPDNLCVRLINYEINKDLLQYIPHVIKFNNLAAVFVLEFKHSYLYVDFNMMRLYGFETIKDLYKAAKKNTEKRHPAVIGTKRVASNNAVKTLNNLQNKDAMILITNETQEYGAAVILYNNVIDKIHEKIGDFILYPCNVHELLAIPFSEQKNEKLLLFHQSLLSDMIEELDVNDFLSDTIYLYRDGTLFTCDLSLFESGFESSVV